jgi:hypothetical protein
MSISRLFSTVFVTGLAINPTQASAQPPAPAPGQPMVFSITSGGSPATLMQSPTVLTELQLKEDQATKLADWAPEFTKASRGRLQNRLQKILANGVLPGVANIGNTIQLEEIDKAYTELADILTKEQIQRVKQINRQLGGINAYNDPAVKEELKLSDEQETKIDRTNSEFNESRMAIRTEYNVNRPNAKLDEATQKEMDTKLEELSSKTLVKIEEILTANQKKAWKDSLGKTVDITKIKAERLQAATAPAK